MSEKKGRSDRYLEKQKELIATLEANLNKIPENQRLSQLAVISALKSRVEDNLEEPRTT